MTDPSLRPHHVLAIETIMCILGTLKSKTANFLNLLIPVFSRIIVYDDLRDKLLNLIEKVIKHCGVYFKIEFIDSVVQIFLEYADD